jgi:hypothetical protein
MPVIEPVEIQQIGAGTDSRDAADCEAAGMRPVILGVIAVIALSGCTTVIVEPAPQFTPETTGSHGPTASAEPSAAPEQPDAQDEPVAPALPDLTSLIIDENGLGPVDLGADPADLTGSDAIVIPMNVTCPGGPAFVRWSANYAERPLGNDVSAFELGKVGTDGVRLVEIYSTGPHTKEGIRVGSHIDDLVEAYPGLLYVDGNGIISQYAVIGYPGNVIYRVTATPYGGWPADTVQSIRVMDTEIPITPAGPHVPGGCA